MAVFDYMKYKIQPENHSHFLYGIYDIFTNNEFLITNINIVSKIKREHDISIICDECPADLKSYIIPLLIKHIRNNAFIDENITLPESFDIKNIIDFDVHVTMNVKNIKREIYEKKIQLYSTKDEPYKTHKYAEKSKKVINRIKERHNTTSNPILLYGGSTMLYQISDEVCDGVPPTKYTNFIVYYSEPYINMTYGFISSFLSEYTGKKYSFAEDLANSPVEDFYPEIDSYTLSKIRMRYNREATDADYDDQKQQFTEAYNNLFDKIKFHLESQKILYPHENEFFSQMEECIKDGLITDITLKDGSWKINLILKHLKMHKYAHNGVNNLSTINVNGLEIGIFDFVKQNLIIDNDWNLFHFIHSLLHAYDAIHIKNGAHYNNDATFIKYAMSFMPEQQSDCLKKSINKYAMDFVSKDADGQIFIPMNIIDDALKDKKRQYTHCISEVFADFCPQIRGFSPLTVTETTINHPNFLLMP